MSTSKKIICYKPISDTYLAAIPAGKLLVCEVSDASTIQTFTAFEKNVVLVNGKNCESDNDRGNKLTVENKFPGHLSELEHIDSLKSAAARLREVKEALDGPKEEFFKKIARRDVRSNIAYAIKILENCLENERKRVISDDDAISEMEQQDLVSPEVKNWLSMTFTRSVSQKNANLDKPKFKSVANAIRAGIMVDRMLRRMSTSLETTAPLPISKVLKTVNEWNFEIFELNQVSENQSLRYLGFELMQKFNILSKFKIQNLVMQNFLEAVEAGYSKYNNPYHNLIHAADVLQTQYTLLNNAGLLSWLTPLEIFAVFISAIVHDFEHTGTTNNFHTQTRSDIALIYNDRAVLENYHISTTFKLFKNDSYNILAGLTREEYKEFRNLCIEMVLATDMSYHFTQIKTIKNTMSLNEKIDKSKALSLILHCADISHPAKTWHLHEVWTNSLVSEFFAQGDREKELGLPYSPLCDRNNTPIAQSQIGFINFIVEPSMVIMGDMIDKLTEQIMIEQNPGKERPSTPKLCDRPWSQSLTENKAKWTELAEEDKKRKESAEANKEKEDAK